MRIDPKQPICGVKPKDLRQLLQKLEFRRWDVARIAEHLGVPPRRASVIVKDLHAEGWLKPERATYGGKRWKYWEPTQKGARLMATKLLPPIRLEVAQAVLPKIVEAARAHNALPDAAWIVTRIAVFGSVFTGSADGLVSDIDIAFDVGQKPMPSREAWIALREAEIDADPTARNHFMGSITGGTHSGDRRPRNALGKVHRSISLHHYRELEELKAPHRVIFEVDR